MAAQPDLVRQGTEESGKGHGITGFCACNKHKSFVKRLLSWYSETVRFVWGDKVGGIDVCHCLEDAYG
jgi:hypothetical protein